MAIFNATVEYDNLVGTDNEADTFVFGDRTFDSIDQVDGKGGQGDPADTMIFTSSHEMLDISAYSFQNIERILLNWDGNNVRFTGNVDRVVPGSTLEVFGRGGGADNIEVYHSTALIADSLIVHGGGGNDTVSGGPGRDRFFGEAGNDILDGRVTNGGEESGADLLDGGAGDDTLTGALGDTLSGGAGNDLFTPVQRGVVINGGAGIDFIDFDHYGVKISAVKFSGVEGLQSSWYLNATVKELSQFTYVRGTVTVTTGGVLDFSGPDMDGEFLSLTVGGKVTDALDITGISGRNNFTGGLGDDTLRGGEGQDTFNGGKGNDLLDGGGGADSFIGHDGDDTIYGRSGDDYIESSFGNDRVYGGAGNDDVVSEYGADTISGGNGNDTISAAPGRITDRNAIYVFGDAGDDWLNVGPGDEKIVSGVVDGGSGFDTIISLGLSELVYSNIEALDIDAAVITRIATLKQFKTFVSDRPDSGGMRLSFIGGGVLDLTYPMRNLDKDINLNGTGSRAYKLILPGGDDTVSGGLGNDTLDGGLGADVLTGRLGLDVFAFRSPLDGRINVDRISDFSVPFDSIGLADSVFAALGTAVEENEFVIGKPAMPHTQKLIYDAGTGFLFYDADGGGAAKPIQFARLARDFDLSHEDFLIL